MPPFRLDPRLAADCHHLGDLERASVLLMDNAQLPWLILVPHVTGEQIHTLAARERRRLCEQTDLLCPFVASFPGVERLNVATLGNVVAQLHVHIVGRHRGDYAWPGPVWGVAAQAPYAGDAVASLRAQLGVAVRAAGSALRVPQRRLEAEAACVQRQPANVDTLAVELWGAPIPYVGCFAAHHWLVVCRGARRDRWEVWQTKAAGGTGFGHLHRNLLAPEAGVGSGPARRIMCWTGERAAALAQRIEDSPTRYRWRERYRYWPGPNSNTYVQWLLGTDLELPRNAIGHRFGRVHTICWQARDS